MTDETHTTDPPEFPTPFDESVWVEETEDGDERGHTYHDDETDVA